MQNEGERKPTIGVIMLNTQFPRFPGDVGNPDSFHCDTLYKVVSSANADSIITGKGIDPAVADDLIAAALELQAAKVDLILTSCGFLGELQGEIKSLIQVPLLTSSLCLLPVIRSLYGSSSKIGVMTFDSAKLGIEHLSAGLTSHDESLLNLVSIEGMESSKAFYRMIGGDEIEGDRKELEKEVIDVGKRFLVLPPGAEITSVILECTNLSPYKQVLRRDLGLPVFDIVDAAHWILGASQTSDHWPRVR